MDMWILWLIIVILLTFLEVITINLVSIWFIASALVSLFLSFMIDSFYIEFAVFVLLGLVLMLITRPILLKKMPRKEVKTNLDRVIGMEGIVTEEIAKHKIGEVKVDGKLWSAIANSAIKEGSTVKVRAIESVKLVVEKVVDETQEIKKTTTTKKKPASTSKKKTTSTANKATSSKKKTATQKKKESEK